MNRLTNTAEIATVLRGLYFSRPDYGEALAAVALSFGIHPDAIGIVFYPAPPIVNVTPAASAAPAAQTMPPWSCFKQNG